MIHKVGIPVVGVPSVEAPLVGWRSKSDAPSPSKTLPLYELACDNTEFVKNTTYTVKVTQIQAPSETMTVYVDCVGGTVTPLDFSTGSIQDLKVTPTADTCTITLTCDGRTVGSFEMRDVLTIPEYIFGSAETEFTQGTEYELIVQRVTAPIKQTQIEVICTGGLVSPAFLVDEGEPYQMEEANSKILVTPTEATCVVTLKVTLAGMTYSVGKFTMKAKSQGVSTSVYHLDQSISDPASMLTGDLGKDSAPEDNVVSWIRANSHRYVGTYNSELGMVLKQLDDNHSTKYADGTDASADITGANGGDMFMKMPTFWLRGESLDTSNNKYDIYFTKKEPNDGKNWVKWDGNTLIGVYKAVCENTSNDTTGKLFSHSGKTPTVNVSQDNFKSKAQNRSNGDDHFMIVTYEAHQVMGLLYMCYYGNMNGQKVIGAGTSSYPKVTGQTNVDGMKDTVAENSRSINFWGLENWWGDLYEWMENLLTTGSGNANILDYSGNVVRSVEITTSIGYITKMLLEEYLDVIAATTGGSVSTYYCDYGSVSSPSGYVGRRSFNSSINNCGPFSLCVDLPASTNYSYYGSRLLYHGRVVMDSPDLLSINSVELSLVPQSGPMRSKAVSGLRTLITIRGNNLDKIDNTLKNLPAGITISELSEGTTERTAVINYNTQEELDQLTLNLGGYEVSVVPQSNPDLQYIYYNGNPILRTGFDFHVCGIEDFSTVTNLKLQGKGIKYEDIEFSSNASCDADGNVTISVPNVEDSISIDMVYNGDSIGVINLHHSTEQEIMDRLHEEFMAHEEE